MKKLRNLISNLLLLLLLTSCGFTSSFYNEILKAQDHIKEQEFSKAAKIYEKILLKKPSKTIEIKINFQLGDIYSIYLNNPQKSINHFNEIVESSNEPHWQIKALEKLGNIHFNDLKNFKESKKIYKKLENFYPPLEDINFYSHRYAMSVFKNKEFKKAINFFIKNIEKSDNEYSVISYYYLGLSNFYLKKYEVAIKNWFEYLKREKRPDLVVDTRFLIANAYESSEKLKQAYNIYYSILGKYPNTSVIKNRLNSLYERRVSRKR